MRLNSGTLVTTGYIIECKNMYRYGVGWTREIGRAAIFVSIDKAIYELGYLTPPGNDIMNVNFLKVTRSLRVVTILESNEMFWYIEKLINEKKRHPFLKYAGS